MKDAKIATGSHKPGNDLYVVGLAASAGGLKALSTILSALPADFPAAVVLVQHLSPHHKSYLAEILARRTSLPVKEAEEGDRLQPGAIFVAPPDRHAIVNPDGSLSLTHAGRVRHVRPSADVLFASMAISCKRHAIAVVLTGGDEDGATGVKLVKAMGGTVMAQNEATSEHFSMPRAAIDTGVVDMVLPLNEIAILLTYFASGGHSLKPLQPEPENKGRNTGCKNNAGCPAAPSKRRPRGRLRDTRPKLRPADVT